jgi:hypothetical protein
MMARRKKKRLGGMPLTLVDLYETGKKGTRLGASTEELVIASARPAESCIRLLNGDFRLENEGDLLELASLVRVPKGLTERSRFRHVVEQISEYFEHIGRELTESDRNLLQKMKITFD